ncbi:MAG: hypothetical protein RLP44_30455 [Aggregatilineales bacterium]
MTEKRDNFTGHWLVSEYVYNPNGAFAGIVRQRRYLEAQPDGRTRVIQHCNPQPELASHPMGLFNGERVFDLSLEGRRRLYHGPDVIGMGLPWGESAMTGRGVWERFGHNFTSFAVLPTPQRQITGGKFYNAGEIIANIIGIAVPEVADGGANQFPDFIGNYQASQVADTWSGTVARYDVNGTQVSEKTLDRRYVADGWEDHSDGAINTVILQKDANRMRVSGSAVGIGKRLGWLLEMTLVPAPNQTIEAMEVLDNSGQNLIGLIRLDTDGVLSGVTVIKLKPNMT